MRVSAKKSTFVVAAATVAIWALVGSASAQVSGRSGGDSAVKSSSGAGGPVDTGSPPTAASVYAHKKADDAMATLRDLPETDANHRKASAAMSR
jgi:hypothetical protein